jgi:Ca-activated chloride channel family protein
MFLSFTVHSQKVNEMIAAGNESYRKGDFEQAEKQYADATKLDPLNHTARFNLASATYRRAKADESLKMFALLAADQAEAHSRASAFYNQGAILSKSKKLEESIEAYKNALRLNPDDKEARENLQKAISELKKKDPPKEKKEDQKKKKEDEQKQQQQQRPKMSQKEAQQRLDLLEQKEKEVQQRLQKERAASGGGGQSKDW